jgi:hypothetical protein
LLRDNDPKGLTMKDPSIIMFFFVVIGVVFALFTMTVASKKGYSSGAWFLGGLFFNLIALIAAVGLPLKRDADEILASQQGRKEAAGNNVSRMQPGRSAEEPSQQPTA